jgi:hypothetical protein
VRLFAILYLVVVLATAGCHEAKPTAGRDPNPQEDTKIRASLDKLSPEDRALAESQRRCPVTDEPLGSMGVPIKVMVNDQPVFVCCSSCIKSATKDPDKTLQKVNQLKESHSKKSQ